jgi:prevent-host-death family protein
VQAVPISRAKSSLDQLIDSIVRSGEVTTITREGSPVAVVVSEFLALVQRADV